MRYFSFSGARLRALARCVAWVLTFTITLAGMNIGTPGRALADPNPCTVTSNGMGGWIVSCTTSPPTVVSPINISDNGGNGGNGGFGTVIFSPGSGGNGGNGGNDTFFEPGTIGSQFIQFPGFPAGVFVQTNGGNGGSGGDADVCVCGGAGGGNGGQGGNTFLEVDPNLAITTDATGVAGIWLQSAGGVGGNGGSGNGALSAGSGGQGGFGGNIQLNAYNAVTTVRDYSYGVFAQSIGGGGGSGGGGLNFGGGSGGTAEAGGNVLLNLGLASGGAPGTVVTYGHDSIGVLAQSIGGFGGVGGSATFLVGSVSGGGGNGGNGGNVSVNTSLDSSIVTQGDDSTGLVAESIGGAGGEGGSGGSLFVTVGGSGSAGGNGGTVGVVNQANITTYGASAKGILAQSIGGGGGDGGSGSSLLVGLGGSGSSTSPGGNVFVFNSGNITTLTTISLSSDAFFGATGIFAQSVGGGGGNGGSSFGLFSIGGSGGGGGAGGISDVENLGSIFTQADNSDGIFTQSLGGGGGNGGGAVGTGPVFSLAIGGSAAAGGSAADAGIFSSGGSITTLGNNSNGMQAQSVGGGGGNGGYAISASGGPISASVGVGGNGGLGGNGGTVEVLNGDPRYGFNGTTIFTTGNNANGILAQSVGGGGGNGGFSISAAGGFASLSLGLGGQGGIGGGGDTVTVTNNNFISTIGLNSNGVLAQSVGGGGGNGGFSVTGDVGAASGGFSFAGSGGSGSTGGDVSLVNGGEIATQSANSSGLIAQSIGGGGGNGGLSVTGNASYFGSAGMSMGGSGGTGGNSGNVTLQNSGFIITAGDRSNGFFAQSLGGGGGNGGLTVTGNISLGPNAGISIGGSGGNGGDAGTVTASNTGTIATLGNDANGLFTQSIGGGGGNGGFAVGGGLSGLATFNAAIGGSGGTGGAANTVTLSNGAIGAGANITTYGNHSNGILAQSLGGGGGNGGFTVAGGIADGATADLGIGGSGGSGASSGDVNVTNYGTIETGAGETTADFANAIFAQSVAGGGGNGGFSVAGGLATGASANIGLGGTGGAGGNAGSVFVDSNGFISTNGEHSVGILAQTIGGGGGNGGFAVAGGLAEGAAMSLGVGGTGSNGGAGGDATIYNIGGAQTAGDDSDALFAQSVGGGGGSGGFSVAGAISGVVSGNISMGGNGGAGASSANASVTSSAGFSGPCNPKTGVVCIPNPATIVTLGNRSDGIAAQSIGGGGGAGGFSIGAGAGYNAALSASIGGAGGNGGSAGFASVVSVDNITTSGDSSNGIFAESNGGGGGEGGFTVGGGASNSVSGGIAIGGIGGNGATSSGAAISSIGTIETSGDSSAGIFAQSMGGSGGNGGFSIAGSIGQGTAAGLSVGGSGGLGSTGGFVTVENAGTIGTQGNDSSGIFAQSNGGGGGNGGFSVTGGVSGSVSLGLSIGGSGGGGGTAGGVSVTSGDDTTASTITTMGDRSDGIGAESIGGNGGNGGFSIAGGAANGPTVSLSLGGFGGTGASAGNVTVSDIGNITTGANGGSGNMSNGIRAQSIGGNGGNGGFSVAAGLGTSVGTSLSIGGIGESGANAGTVAVNWGDLTNNVSGGTIVTNGQQSNGIFAQSVGGGGGSGGFALGASASQGPGANFSLGGFGGDGGTGNTVTVTSLGNIGTFGNNSNGILAQSVGGGGGNGGFSIAGSLSNAPSAAATVGGFGGVGSNAGNAGITSIGTIGTLGNNSDAIIAQSVGGGGGNGGFSIAGNISNGAAAGLSVGGFGGGAGTGGDASVFVENATTAANAPTIFTQGNQSDAILAQSVGGGGGNGGFSVNGVVNNGWGLSASLGGLAGSGASAGGTHVYNTATIATFGNQSDGIEAQSAGGGGGNGGWSVAGTVSDSNSAALTVGGFGGTGGNGGVAIVENYGTAIITQGAASVGLLAQSLGGGGGNGGFSVAGDVNNSNGLTASLGGFGGAAGTGSRVSVISTGLNGANFIGTSGAQADGILAQSIGGGGGNAGWEVAGTINDGKGASLGMGGIGGGGGDADGVFVNANTVVVTTGDQSSAIAAQSIGGGGGNGGWSVTGVLSNNTNATLSLGGDGGGAGNGSIVQLTSLQNVSTAGNNADALLAQSIGGGGGNGGFSVGAGFTTNSYQLADSFGGNGGTAGSGSDVTLTSGSSSAPVTIVTQGAASDGIFAQSLGGGGGNGGFTVNASATGDKGGQPDPAKFGMAAFNIGYGACSICPGSGGGDANNAGTVTVTSNSAITTNGDNANDIVAQSVGGGGGKGAWTIGATADNTGPSVQMQFGAGGGGGNGGDVSVTSAFNLVTNGANSDGILAQSTGGGGGYGGLSATNGLITDIPGLTGLALGQHGDQGGNAGNVTVTSSSNIQTVRGNSDGIVAQSVGGGGGQGGFSIQAGVSIQAGNASSILNYALGSNGGAGGSAGNVGLTSTASTIQTQGANADGILAQSVGGGGGDGGFAINVAYTPSWAVGFSMGGKGGAAGDAGSVSVTNATQVTTLGDLAAGIVEQSIGGGGGSGGFAIEALGSTGLVADSAVGGFSSGGTDGGSVTMQNTGVISTTGEGADALLAESIGGGGGSGGFAIAGGAAATGKGAFFSFGGGGSSGGNGGEVNATNNATSLTTKGNNSQGFVGESLGGGGGDGGFSIAGGYSGQGTLDLSLGGSAGSGGNGGAVVATSGNSTSLTTIATSGNDADGFLAESLGGGGGNGGFSIAGGVTGGSSINLGIGGFGSTGGSGGSVSASNDSSIRTTGINSDAMVAQSIGGGGGNGGFSIAATLDGGNSAFSTTLDLGGFAGNGGSGGAVFATNGALLLNTSADFSDGMLVQSVGGGGGNGGFSIAGTGSLGKRNLDLNMGGSGGNGGASGNVTAISGIIGTPTFIVTQGTFADGILAQSVGGGGGNGGFAVEGLASPGSSFGYDLGGSGGAGNNAGTVTVANFSTIGTSGVSAIGLAAQSIGGGGGQGGIKVSASVANDAKGFSTTGMFGFGNGGGGGNADTVTVGNAGIIATSGINSDGLVAQSIGGGGGYGGFSYLTQILGVLGVGLGSTTDGGGTAGDVNVINTASIGTLGDNADDILAQSVGGGGGKGGFGISGGFNTNPTSNLSGLNLALGSNGGAGGSAGNVSVTSNAALLSTFGNNANGIVAESIGGGGGDGGFAVAADMTASKYGIGLSLGGAGGSAGNAGNVTINNTSTIVTHGANSDDIIAESLGGGGGDGGFALNVLSSEGLSGNVAIGASGGSGGNSGNVTINSSGGVLETTGFDSTAIVAQSVAGGGGSGGIGVAGFAIAGVPLLGLSVGGNDGNGGTSGTVTINNTSAVETLGDFSSVTSSQSVGGGGGVGVTDVADATNSTLTSIIDVGANGGFGGNGLAANNTNSGLLITRGLGSNAFVGQSVGGGGGFAGFEVAHNLSMASGPGGLTFGANFTTTCVNEAGAIVCNGGSGDGGSITATNAHEIDTTGDASSAIFAQSVGGGGGDGVFSVGGTYTGTALEITEGANGAFGNGGAVTVSNGAHSLLTTLGLHADAIVAQSIGSGGGYGTVETGQGLLGGATLSYQLGATSGTATPFTGGNGGAVGVSNGSAIVTHGNFSSGILAQSIGDGGGDGAINVGGAVAAGGGGLVSQLGGSNLAGGSGGAITLGNTGTIGITGNDAFGMLVQSIGGGGGAGGFSGSISDTLGTSSLAGYALGGTNVSGTSGGAIAVTNSAGITTLGTGDGGLVAQSIAGGGGESGYGLSLALGTSSPALLALFEGGTGSQNTGGNLTLSNSAMIGTAGANASDVIGQSISGGGGNGGYSVTGTLTTSTGSIPQLDLLVGGRGGFGNNAGNVSYTGTAPLISQGDGSAALVAQSIGQGGGNGEMTFTGQFSSGTPMNASVNVGSTAIGSGNGDIVTLNNTGAIQTGSMMMGTTTGAFADGILAQSIGGGGGSGVLTMGLGVPSGTAATGNVNLNVGGPAGCAFIPGAVNCQYAGGAVSVADTGTIVTAGAYAAGIAAQSIGDGGGNATADIFGTSTLASGATPSKYNLDMTVGGGSGIGNSGGNVTVTHGGGGIATFGNDADAIAAQSIGGGGGNGGSLRSVLETPGTCSTTSTSCSAQLASANIAVGGFGLGQSNSGGSVTVTNKSNLSTMGSDADAILAQSIGGGGGTAADLDANAHLGTFKLTVGGSQSDGGSGGAVSVSDAGNISTQGNEASAIFAQSVGGGGGIGGLGLSPSATGTIALGGASGANGNGGNVSVSMCCGPAPHVMPNIISTTGNGAFGIFAQSVGGGGGVAGNIDNGEATMATLGSSSTLTATGGGGGNGGSVTISDTGDISTTGNGADGIFAQSIGGGGGLTTGFAGSAGGAGNGGAVSVTQNGILATTGSGATAIFAQSAGGTGTGGNVTVNVTGDALAYGANANGITAQSIGGGGNGNIAITINAGSVVQGGTGTGSAGVAILGGASNSLLNFGTITTASSPHAVAYPFTTYRFDTSSGIESTQLASTGDYQTTSLMTGNASLLSLFVGENMSKQQGPAIFADAGTLNLTNDGKIYGSIVTNGAILDLTNDGVIVSGSQMNIGTDGLFTLGAGSLMTPGGGGYVATTNLTGNLREMPGSNYLVSLDLTNNTASNFNVSGTASVAGTVDLDLLSTNAAAPGSHSESIVTAAGGVTNNGLTLAPPQSAVATFNLAYQPNDVLLDYDINYAPTIGSVLDRNDLAFGDYIGRIQTAGSTPKLASFMSTVFAIPTVGDLKGFYDRFAPDTSVALSSAALLSNIQFSDSMLNCHAGSGFTEQNNGCNWGTIGTQSGGQNASSTSGGFAQSAMDFAAGFEHRIGNGQTSVGAAVHYANGSLSDSSAATTLTGGTLSAGFSASHVLSSGVVLSADLFGGEGNYNSGRTVGYPALTTQATGTQQLSFIGTHLRADRYFGNSVNSVTPYVDFGLMQVNVGALDESGAGVFDENVAAHHDVLPTVAVGAQFEKLFQRKSTQFRFALNASATQLLGNAQSLTTATLAGAPAGVAPFMLTNTMDRTYFGLTPSLEITNNNKLGVRISGSYNFSASTHALGTYVQFTTKLGGGSL